MKQIFDYEGERRGSFRYIAAMSAVLAIRWTLCDIRRLSRHPLFSVAVSPITAIPKRSLSSFIHANNDQS